MATPTPTAADIQKRLEARTRSVTHHLAAIRQEFAPLVATSDDGAPPSARDPLSSGQRVGIALGAALAVGIVSALWMRRDKQRTVVRMATTANLYVDHVLDEAARVAAEGKNPDDALRKVLRRRPAIIHVETPDPIPDRSILSGVGSSLVRTAVIYAVEAGAAWLIARSRTGRSGKQIDRETP